MRQPSLPADGILAAFEQVPHAGDRIYCEETADAGADDRMRSLLAATGIVVERLAQCQFGGKERQGGEAGVLVYLCPDLVAVTVFRDARRWRGLLRRVDNRVRERRMQRHRLGRNSRPVDLPDSGRLLWKQRRW